MPVCFSSKSIRTEEQRKRVIRYQYRTFKTFSIIAFVTYGAALATIGVIVHLPLGLINFQYDPNVILNHFEFNLILGAVAATACIATVASMKPRVTSWCKRQANLPGWPHRKLLMILIFDSFHLISAVPRGKTNRPLLPDIVGQDLRPPVPSSRSCCQSLWFILIRFGLTILTFAPIILSITYLVSVNHQDRSGCYIHYSPASNSTVTFRAIAVSPSASGCHAQGVGKLFVTTDLKTIAVPAPAQFVPPEVSVPGESGVIAITQRNNWMKKKDSIMDSGVSGVIILDDETYQPSSPVPGLVPSSFPRVPVLLVRKEDVPFFSATEGSMLWIRSGLDLKTVSGSWKCSESGCLPPAFNDGFINGTEYRTSLCYWGGRACTGQNNSQEVLPYCNGPDTQVCPLNGNEFGVFQSFSFFDVKRSMRSSPASCVAQQSFEVNVFECDNGEFSSV